MIPNLIVPTLKRYDLLQRMISSIDYPVEHLLIIDNGNLIDQLKLPEMVKEMTVLTMPANLGVSSSWNLGVKCFPFAPVWFIASDDVEFLPGTLEAWSEMSNPDSMIVSDDEPFFQFFSVGENVVNRVGLFDEAIHPANFEDNEYEWRCNQLGFNIERVNLPHNHTKQGTVHDRKYVDANHRTYAINQIYFEHKISQNILTAGEWSLDRRRANSWD